MRKQKLAYSLLALFILAAGLTTSFQSNVSGTNNMRISKAIPMFFSFGGEKVIKAAEFPNTPDYMNNGEYVDTGVRYKHITLFFIPIWNYDAKWCGYMGKSDKYVILGESDLKDIATEAGVTLPKDPESAIPFWDKWGGKLLIILLIAAYIFYLRTKKK